MRYDDPVVDMGEVTSQEMSEKHRWRNPKPTYSNCFYMQAVMIKRRCVR